MHLYELFTFRDICKKTPFIKNIFIKLCIHKENIFMRTHLVFLCPASHCYCWMIRDRGERN